MPIVGFEFTKIDVEKQSKITGKVKVNHNINIKSVETEKFSLPKPEEILKFTFHYKVDYQPKIGHITLDGFVLLHEDAKKTKEIIADWKKSKKIPTPITQQIVNTILFRCSIKALTMSQEVNLPPHLPLPKLKPGKDPSNYIG